MMTRGFAGFAGFASEDGILSKGRDAGDRDDGVAIRYLIGAGGVTVRYPIADDLQLPEATTARGVANRYPLWRQNGSFLRK